MKHAMHARALVAAICVVFLPAWAMAQTEPEPPKFDRSRKPNGRMVGANQVHSLRSGSAHTTSQWVPTVMSHRPGLQLRAAGGAARCCYAALRFTLLSAMEAECTALQCSNIAASGVR